MPIASDAALPFETFGCLEKLKIDFFDSTLYKTASCINWKFCSTPYLVLARTLGSAVLVRACIKCANLNRLCRSHVPAWKARWLGASAVLSGQRMRFGKPLYMRIAFDFLSQPRHNVTLNWEEILSILKEIADRQKGGCQELLARISGDYVEVTTFSHIALGNSPHKSHYRSFFTGHFRFDSTNSVETMRKR